MIRSLARMLGDEGFLSAGPPLKPRQAEAKRGGEARPAPRLAAVRHSVKRGDEFLTAFRGDGVIAWTGAAHAENSSSLISNQRRGAGLAAIHSQKILAHKLTGATSDRRPQGRCVATRARSRPARRASANSSPVLKAACTEIRPS